MATDLQVGAGFVPRHAYPQRTRRRLMKLRDYQTKAIDSVRDSMRSGNKHVGLMLATGAGKTIIAASIIRTALSRGIRCLFIVDRVDLIDQTSKSFDSMGIDHGVIQADHWRVKPHENLQICSIQTLARRRVPDAGLVIVDEFHSVYSAQIKLMKAWDAVPMIGLSATPFTKGLGIHWDDLVVGATTKQLIDLGYLSKYIAYGPTNPNLDGVKTLGGDFNQKQLAKKVNKKTIIGDVVRTWLARGEFRQTICFAVDIAHSKAIVDEFQCNNIKAEHIDAYTDSDERREAIAKFKAGEIKILSSVDILTKGFDYPAASCLILARPTKSLIVHIQQCGRILRTFEGKTEAIILDHAGNIARLGFPTDVLPEVMCNGDKKEVNKKEREKPLPKPCIKCSFLKEPGQLECPQCGHKHVVETKVEAQHGELQKIERVNTEEKLRWYSGLLHIARTRGFQDGWASHKYKEKFGVWPARKTGVHPKEPDEDILNYVKHLQIKRSYSMKKRKCKCGSTEFNQSAGTGPHSARLDCKQCGRFVAWLPKNEA